MDRTRLIDYLSALTDNELNELLVESRSMPTNDVKTLIERELNREPCAPNDDDALTRRALGG